MANFAIAHIDEIPLIQPENEAAIRPIRHHLGISAFGVNAWVGKEPGERIINDHGEDEDDGQEELYLVLQGRASFELEGERHDAPAGTLVFVPSKTKRTAFAEEPNTTVVAVGASATKTYTPVGWELWYPLRKKYEAGEYAEVAARLREIVADAPQYALLSYNLACLESLLGDKADAVGHLRQAVELSDEIREIARNDSDLDAIRDEPEVRELLASPA